MKPIANLLAAAALVGAFGPACALDRNAGPDLPAHPPGAAAGFLLIPSTSAPYSFAEICRLGIWTPFPMASGIAADPAATRGIALDWPRPGAPAPALYAGSSIMNADTWPAAAPAGLADMLAIGAFPRPYATSPSAQEGHHSLSSPMATSGPASRQLLGGLAVMLAMAWRRRGWLLRSALAIPNPIEQRIRGTAPPGSA